jgi:putative transposase
MDLGERAGRFIIRDRDGKFSKFTTAFDDVFAGNGTRVIRTPVRSPRANAICERLVGTLRREPPGRLLIIDEQHLRRVLTESLRHYNTARPHRSLGRLTPAQADTCPPEPVTLAEYRIHRRQVPGALTQSATSPPDCPQDTPNRIFEPHSQTASPT